MGILWQRGYRLRNRLFCLLLTCNYPKVCVSESLDGDYVGGFNVSPREWGSAITTVPLLSEVGLVCYSINLRECF